MVRQQDWLCFVGNKIQYRLVFWKLLAVLTFRLRMYLSRCFHPVLGQSEAGRRKRWDLALFCNVYRYIITYNI